MHTVVYRYLLDLEKISEEYFDILGDEFICLLPETEMRRSTSISSLCFRATQFFVTSQSSILTH